VCNFPTLDTFRAVGVSALEGGGAARAIQSLALPRHPARLHPRRFRRGGLNVIELVAHRRGEQIELVAARVVHFRRAIRRDRVSSLFIVGGVVQGVGIDVEQLARAVKVIDPDFNVTVPLAVNLPRAGSGVAVSALQGQVGTRHRHFRLLDLILQVFHVPGQSRLAGQGEYQLASSMPATRNVPVCGRNCSSRR